MLPLEVPAANPLEPVLPGWYNQTRAETADGTQSMEGSLTSDAVTSQLVALEKSKGEWLRGICHLFGDLMALGRLSVENRYLTDSTKFSSFQRCQSTWMSFGASVLMSQSLKLSFGAAHSLPGEVTLNLPPKTCKKSDRIWRLWSTMLARSQKRTGHIWKMMESVGSQWWVFWA